MELIRLELRQGLGLKGRKLAWLAPLLVLSVSLSACSYLSGGAEDPGQPKKGSILENIVMGGPAPNIKQESGPAAQTRFPDAVSQGENEFDCPVLDVAANGASLRDFAAGAESGAQEVRDQISITRLGRECKEAGASISMKLGVEGSVLLGPSGAPGTFKVPLLFEARLNDKVVGTRRETVSVTIPPGEERAFYSTVLTDFIIPKDDGVDVYVGLNRSGDKALTPPKHRVRRKRR